MIVVKTMQPPFLYDRGNTVNYGHSVGVRGSNPQVTKNKPKRSNKHMARKRIVSRRIKAVVYDVLCMNTETAEPFNTEITLNAAVKGKDVMKKIRALVDTETVKAVHVVGETPINKVFAMDEEAFIANAYEITPKNHEENEEVSE